MAHEKFLLVEGEDDKRVIPQLVEANGVTWENKHKEPIVTIKALGSVEQLLDKQRIEVRLKDSNLKILGVIIDADEYPENRWQSIRNCLIERYPNIPKELPESGLIHSIPEQVKIGVWMMPDNKGRGMLETFLQVLLPEGGEALWDFSQQSCQQAKEQGACFKDCHSDKAKIHTWLAWQNPPGRQIHQAIMERILSPASPQAAIFMQWFRELFEV